MSGFDQAMDRPNPVAFSSAILNWWDSDHADLPWRRTRDPYAIWVAEVMLQQTQIVTVIDYYERWMVQFPSIEALARATLDDVLKAWEGLGYYSRARNLHAAAGIIVEQHDGRLPQDSQKLQELPGIGRYTAAAIASIAHDEPAAVLDGNVIRVLSRVCDLTNDVTAGSTKQGLWRLAADLLPRARPGDHNQALMELGQRICLPQQPQCANCPVAGMCLARERGTQLERPVKRPRKRTPHYDVVAGVIWRTEPSEKGEFLIARRPLEKMLGGLWEFPGGKVENGEDYRQALQREIAEELNIGIVVDQQLCRIKHAYTHFRITLHCYYARILAGEPEHIGVADHAWVALADLHGYAFAVTDLQIIEALRNALQPGD